MHRGIKENSLRLSLFQLFVRMKHCQADVIRDFLSERNAHYGAALRGLEESLLKHLVSQQASATTTMKLNSLLSEVEWLYRRGLFDMMSRKIEQGLKISDENERANYGLQFRHWRIMQLFATEKMTDDLDQLESQIRDVSVLSGELEKYLTVYHLAHYTDSVLARPEYSYQDQTAIIQQKVLSHQILKDQIPQFKSGQHAYFDLLASAQFYLENWEQSVVYTDSLLQNFKGRREQGADIGAYQIAMILCNLMTLSNYNRDQQAFEKYRKEFDQLFAESSSDPDFGLIEKNCIPRRNIQRMKAAGIFARPEVGHKLIREFLEPWIETNIEDQVKIQTAVEIADFYFQLSDFSAMSTWTNYLFQFSSLRDEKEVFYASSWMQLIAYCGLEQESLFESRARSFLNYLRERRGRNYELERKLIGLLQHIIGVTIAEKSKQCISFLEGNRLGLEEIRKPSRFIDLIAWLERADEDFWRGS
jgi:hypothetical protein